MSHSESTWDRLHRWERFHRLFEPVDFRRWKRASQKHLRTLFPASGLRVLDATAGLGDHSVNLAELGFVVTAGDASEVAREATTEAARAAGVTIEVADLRWETVGRVRPLAYDLVFHDALHWIERPDTMQEVLRSLRATLRPKGALVFFFADPRDASPGAGERVRQWDLAHLPRLERLWQHPWQGGTVTHEVMRLPSGDAIDERHAFSIDREDATSEMQEATLRRIYRWDFHAMQEACGAAGFASVEGHVFDNDKGLPTSMCLARV
ncbi:MAG: methyltransferase domain-containing protein [Sandaracinaceae bacterium]|nr:methyltransferase domain-containing protein [Sandaracinaceae bacterium]